jgi:hypothetical protein
VSFDGVSLSNQITSAFNFIKNTDGVRRRCEVRAGNQNHSNSFILFGKKAGIWASACRQLKLLFVEPIRLRQTVSIPIKHRFAVHEQHVAMRTISRDSVDRELPHICGLRPASEQSRANR